MIKIIIVSSLIAIFGFISVWRIFNLVRNKVKGEEINYKNQFSILGSLIVVIGILCVYDIYLGVSLANQNKNEILDYGQKAIASTVEYGTTAIFEGIGKTVDHFQEKWEDNYMTQLKNVDVEIKEITKESIDDKDDKVFIDLIFNNKNSESDRLNLGHISDNNYILISDEDGLYYPLKISNNQYDNFLPTGKTVLKFEGIIPSTMQVEYIRLLDERVEITEEK